MVTIYLNRQIDDPVRRTSIYNGDFYLYTGIQEAVALRDHARSMIAQAFAGIDPQRAQYLLEVPEFVKRVGPLKSRFTNDARTKELVRDFLIALGCDPITTFFDLPRLRAVASNNYLTAGVSYAYKAHRDTWYAHPPMLVNYWVPIYTVVGDNVMSMWPGYFHRPVANDSANWDYERWVAEARFRAEDQVGEEKRAHPLPQEKIDQTSEIRIAGNGGDVMMFSTCHLHATAPKQSGVTRFSYDLRTIDINDFRAGRGPHNIDGAATGSTIGDFLRVADFAPLGSAESSRNPESILSELSI